MRLDADIGANREANVLVGRHVFGVTTIQQVPARKGAQEAAAQICLYLGHSRLIDSTGLTDIGLGGVVVTLACELANTNQRKPDLKFSTII